MIEFLKIMAPVVTIVIAWFLNERGKRATERERLVWEQFTRKEDGYRKLLDASNGFSLGAADAKELQAQFLAELRFCWLYGSDEVILAANTFLDSVKEGSEATAEQRETTLAKFVASLRNDILSHRLVSASELTAKDYRLLRTQSVVGGESTPKL